MQKLQRQFFSQKMLGVFRWLFYGVILVILLGVFSYGIRWYYYKYFFRQCEVGDPAAGVSTILVLRLADDSGSKPDVDELEVIVDRGQLYSLKFDKTDWLRVYYQPVRVVQIASILRLLRTDEYDPCQIQVFLRNLLGLPINRFVLYNGSKLTYTNLGLSDFLRFMFSTKFWGKKVDLSATPTQRLTLATGEEVLAYSYDDILSAVKELYVQDKVLQEGLFVEVYNATQKPGYASYWARLLQNFGIDVIRVGNAFKPVEFAEYDVFIYVDERAKNTQTIEIVKGFFQNQKVYWSQERPPFLLTTGDIVIVLLR